MESWASFIAGDAQNVLSFFREIFYDVLPWPIVAFLFLFPAFCFVYGLVRFFRDIFK